MIQNSKGQKLGFIALLFSCISTSPAMAFECTSMSTPQNTFKEGSSTWHSALVNAAAQKGVQNKKIEESIRVIDDIIAHPLQYIYIPKKDIQATLKANGITADLIDIYTSSIDQIITDQASANYPLCVPSSFKIKPAISYIYGYLLTDQSNYLEKALEALKNNTSKEISYIYWLNVANAFQTLNAMSRLAPEERQKAEQLGRKYEKTISSIWSDIILRSESGDLHTSATCSTSDDFTESLGYIYLFTLNLIEQYPIRENQVKIPDSIGILLPALASRSFCEADRQPEIANFGKARKTDLRILYDSMRLQTADQYRVSYAVALDQFRRNSQCAIELAENGKSTWCTTTTDIFDAYNKSVKYASLALDLSKSIYGTINAHSELLEFDTRITRIAKKLGANKNTTYAYNNLPTRTEPHAYAGWKFFSELPNPFTKTPFRSRHSGTTAGFEVQSEPQRLAQLVWSTYSASSDLLRSISPTDPRRNAPIQRFVQGFDTYTQTQDSQNISNFIYFAAVRDKATIKNDKSLSATADPEQVINDGIEVLRLNPLDVLQLTRLYRDITVSNVAKREKHMGVIRSLYRTFYKELAASEENDNKPQLSPPIISYVKNLRSYVEESFFGSSGISTPCWNIYHENFTNVSKAANSILESGTQNPTDSGILETRQRVSQIQNEQNAPLSCLPLLKKFHELNIAYTFDILIPWNQQRFKSPDPSLIRQFYFANRTSAISTIP